MLFRLLFLQMAFDSYVSNTDAKITTMMEDILPLTDVVKNNLKELEEEMSLVKRIMNSRPTMGETSSKIKVPEPKVFGGTRSAKDLENFLWDMEQYFKAAHVPDGEKVTITSMYLSSDVKLW